jgi:hypothetical protein
MQRHTHAIAELNAKMERAAMEKQLSVSEAVRDVERQRDELNAKLSAQQAERLATEAALREKYASELRLKEEMIRSKDEELEYRKEMKLKLSTKMVGESLEQHCENEFNKLWATAFPRAEFYKDNDISAGTKGDYIFREKDEAGNEIVSIMFEMKNENEDTATKKRNEDFLAKLDKDRIEKKCEYAVLVSLLELTTSSTIPALPICHTGTRRCMWCVHSSSSRSSACCETPRRAPLPTSKSWRWYGIRAWTSRISRAASTSSNPPSPGIMS